MIAIVSLLLVVSGAFQASALVDNGTSSTDDGNATEENVTGSADCTAGTGETSCDAAADGPADGASKTNASAGVETLCGEAPDGTCSPPADVDASAQASASGEAECSLTEPPDCRGEAETDPSPAAQENRSVEVAGVEVVVEVQADCSPDPFVPSSACSADVDVTPDPVDGVVELLKGLSVGDVQIL